MNNKRRVLSALALLLAVSLSQPLVAQKKSSDSIKIPFETYKLSNGLTVILSVDRTTPTVAVNIWYYVGSKNEMPGRTGFAHLFEHVMFTGSGNVPYGYHDKLTEGVGGSNNGTTNADRTNYFETIPSNYLETALWLESDRMGFLLDKLDIAKLNAQMNAIFAEPGFRKRVTDMGVALMGGAPGEVTSYIATEKKKWSEVVQAAGVKVD